ncbi:Calx-beta domain-containing protein [Paludisphaera soli]|uniref:Calx-beta domain-containing protein n=1 Tax=Paludisphaera soli TaxID=2712865 RepID=UPI0013EA097A|nr:Calx-beta domain-containing protein [Paludisphaera soli]
MKSTPRRSPRRGRRDLRLEFLEGRTLLADGAPGPVFEVAETATGAYRSDAGGGLVTVAWEADDGSGLGIYARRFDDGGRPLEDPFLVNSETAGDQSSPRLAVAPGLAIVAWWSDSRLYYRRYDDQGRPLGAASPLMGTLGTSPDFEIFDLDDEGFTVYSRGFQLRRYGLDGAPQAVRTLSSDLEGWTTVESTDPARAAVGFGENTVVTWSRYRAREQARVTVYDAQLVAAYLSPEFESRTFVVADEVGLPSLDEATGLDPGVRDAGTGGPPLYIGGALLVTWRDGSTHGPVIRGRELLQGRYGSFGELTPGGDVLQFSDESGGVPTAVSGVGELKVHFVRPAGAGGPAESYLRTWTAHRAYPSIPSAWQAGSRIATPEARRASSRSFTIQPTALDESWLMHVDASGEVFAQRLPSTEEALRAWSIDVTESVGRAVVGISRTGDLSQPLSVHYETADPGGGMSGPPAAIPGVDYTPVSGVIVLEAGQSRATVEVPIRDDDASNGERRFRLVATAPTSGLAASAVVTIVDDEPGPARGDLTLFDYGPSGLWSLDDAGAWRRLAALDPTRVLALPGGAAVADFGAEGLWARGGDSAWRRINDVSPEAMIQGAGRAFLDFGPRGLWSWSESEGWAHLNDVDPRAMTGDDRSLYVDFTRGGLWAWTPTGGYAAISPDGPHPEAMTSHGGVVYLDYGSSGLWSWGAGGGWTWINGADPEALVAGAGGLFVDYGPHGVWTWDAAGEASRLTPADARSLAIADGSLFASFDAGGLRRWTASGGWTQLNGVAPTLVKTSPGAPDAILDYGPQGVWRWDPTSGWKRINDLSPTSLVRV